MIYSRALRTALLAARGNTEPAPRHAGGFTHPRVAAKTVSQIGLGTKFRWRATHPPVCSQAGKSVYESFSEPRKRRRVAKIPNWHPASAAIHAPCNPPCNSLSRERAVLASLLSSRPAVRFSRQLSLSEEIISVPVHQSSIPGYQLSFRANRGICCWLFGIFLLAVCCPDSFINAQEPASGAGMQSPANPARTSRKSADTAASPSIERGEAAFYSNSLEGHKTACGGIYSPGELTAAHPTRKCGTKLRVTNLRNGKVVRVTVNDRLPPGKRVIDLSYAAAEALGFVKQGTTLVKVESAR
jgi:rare lipoprotein A